MLTITPARLWNATRIPLQYAERLNAGIPTLQYQSGANSREHFNSTPEEG
jgi:hypothetical protein